MRQTSAKRRDPHNQPRKVATGSLYSKESNRYFPKEDVIIVSGKRVRTYDLEEANELGLCTVNQLAEKIGVDARTAYSWMDRRGVKPVSQLKQPKYGPQMSTPDHLYSMQEIIAMWEKAPLKPRHRRYPS